MQNSKRPETGVMIFGDDWPGIFIRGDNVVGLVILIERALDGNMGPIDEVCLKSWALSLRAAQSPPSSDSQRLKPWDECISTKAN